MKTCNCPICGKVIEYKTKPPKQCQECRISGQKIEKNNSGNGKTKKRKFVKPKKGKNGSSSSKEGLMFDLLDEVFSGYNYINNGYYSWLMSPKKVPMQLDRYYPDLKIAWEYDGRQHFEYNPYFHHSKKQFNYLQDCDALKNELCEKNGVVLIRVKYNKKITKEYLLYKLKETSPELYNKLFED